MAPADPAAVEVIAPNFKRRLSGVTATVVRLVPLQARDIAIVATGPALPPDVPQMRLRDLLTMPRRGPSGARVWHARRNVEMLGGLALKHLLRKRLKLLFTSAAQRHHSGLTRWLIRQMDAVVATSPQAASYLEQPATVIMHGIDAGIFHPIEDKAALRADLGLDLDAVLIGCFGRVRAQKGVDLLVEAGLRLLPARPKVQIVFTGRITSQHRSFVDSLNQRITAAGLADRIRFLGELPWEQVVRLHQAMDIFCAPARWEGFGLTPLEAMACGVPAVGARVGAYEALIQDGATGSLFPAGDADALTAALEHWIDNPEGRRDAGAAARQHMLENFRIEDEAAALNAVYRALLTTP